MTTKTKRINLTGNLVHLLNLAVNAVFLNFFAPVARQAKAGGDVWNSLFDDVSRPRRACYAIARAPTYRRETDDRAINPRAAAAGTLRQPVMNNKQAKRSHSHGNHRLNKKAGFDETRQHTLCWTSARDALNIREHYSLVDQINSLCTAYCTA